MVVDLKIRGFETANLPYTVRLYGVTEEMFDDLVDEDSRAELINGVMIVHSPASLQHDNRGGFLRALMSIYAEERALGLVLGPDSLVHLATCRKFAPDIFFIRQERVPTPLPKQFEGAPDLVVEVLSPLNRSDDLDNKRPAYHEAGVEVIWWVDAEYREVIVDRREADGYHEEIVTEGKLFSSVLEGFWIDVSWLWAEPLPNKMACLQEILQR